MKGFSFSEFRPTILFLAKFIGLYVASNFLYGLYVTSFHSQPDSITNLVARHTAVVLASCGYNGIEVVDHSKKPNTLILHDQSAILSIYEGCNGINTMIMFVAFVFAFGPISKTTLWFIPAGLIIIHMANLGRITLLFYVAENFPQFTYFAHKYFFTATLYAVIFAMWFIWVKTIALKK